jgi:hypothetical protein
VEVLALVITKILLVLDTFLSPELLARKASFCLVNLDADHGSLSLPFEKM